MTRIWRVALSWARRQGPGVVIVHTNVPALGIPESAHVRHEQVAGLGLPGGMAKVPR